jgi:hypothetical protein
VPYPHHFLPLPCDHPVGVHVLTADGVPWLSYDIPNNKHIILAAAKQVWVPKYTGCSVMHPAGVGAPVFRGYGLQLASQAGARALVAPPGRAKVGHAHLQELSHAVQ